MQDKTIFRMNEAPTYLVEPQGFALFDRPLLHKWDVIAQGFCVFFYYYKKYLKILEFGNILFF